MTDKHRILVVEDDIGWQGIIRKALEKYGYSVIHANNIDEAKLRLQEYQFSLATVDLNYKENQSTPEQEYGTDLLEYIKHNYPELPCIIITASDDRDEESAVDLVLDFKPVVRSYLKKTAQIRNTLPKKIEMILATCNKSDKDISEKPQPKYGLGKEIFISYAWGGESEEIVNQLDEVLQSKGITIVRDKRDLGFKGCIKSFMEQIGRGKAVIVVISDKYLKSENCMFELLQIANHGQFYDRIFPIVLADAKIYKPINRIKYIDYWESQIRELDEAMKSVGSANLQGIREGIDLYTEIRTTIAKLTTILTDMNALTPDMHRASGFRKLIESIEEKINRSN
ncbi:MAG: hypothetical protein FOGNACKC_01959 [Anaerolineae bacterium]|nr:hypothetical protein [Anaerolineae bacterium]